MGSYIFANSGLMKLHLGHLGGGLVLEMCALMCCSELVELVLPAGAEIGALALSGLKALKRLRVQSLSGFHETALDGTAIDEIELGNECLRDSSRILARLSPVRVICGGKVIEFEEPKLTRFVVDGVGIIPPTGALELAGLGTRGGCFRVFHSRALTSSRSFTCKRDQAIFGGGFPFSAPVDDSGCARVRG
jgi:hypothetical protein